MQAFMVVGLFFSFSVEGARGVCQFILLFYDLFFLQPEIQTISVWEFTIYMISVMFPRGFQLSNILRAEPVFFMVISEVS